MEQYNTPPFPGFNPDDPTVPIDSHVIDWMMCDMSGRELRVYLTLVRELTWDGANTVAISVRRLMERTGLGRSTVIEALWMLTARKLVEKVPRTREDGSTAANAYRLLPFPDDALPPYLRGDTSGKARA